MDRRWMLSRHLFVIVCLLAGFGLCTDASIAQSWEFDFWGSVSPPADWSLDAGDFDGDGRSDLIVYHPSDGSLAVGTSTYGAFSFVGWANVSPTDGWSIAAGDFDGDQRSDVALYHPSDGTVTIGINQEGSFAFASWGHMSPVSGWELNAGDFDGDGLADVALYRPADGRIVVGTNQAGSFEFSDWATLSPAADWSLDPGRYDDDARVDLLAYHQSDGSVRALLSSGSGFQLGPSWATLIPSAGWLVHSADVCLTSVLLPCTFESDGLDDFVAYYPGDGTIWAGRNTGNESFWTGASALFTTTPTSGWTFVGGHFWRPDIGGVAFYYPGDGSIYVSAGQPVAKGYAWPLSAAPGDSIDFMVSGAALPTVSFYRHTSVADGTGPSATAPVQSDWKASLTFVAEVQTTQPDAYRLGAGWSPSFDLTVPASWPSGFYSAQLTGPTGDETHITFIVKPDPGARSRVALLANTNTWNAYTIFEGMGKYVKPIADPPIFSFLRPSSYATSPLEEGGAAKHLTRAELWIHGFLESDGHSPDVYTDYDMHQGGFLSDYDFLVLSTHPEYWSAEMYDALQAFLGSGGSLLYLGGNGVFEEVRYVYGDTALEFNAGDAALPRADAFFRNVQPPRPERSLLGMTTEDCSLSPGFAYTILDAGHPLLAGTGLQAGELVGDYGLNTGGNPGSYNGKAAGHETDTSAGPGAIAATVCGLDPPSNPLPPAPLPPGLQVIGRAGSVADPGSEMTYYVHPGGGIVLSAGSINFGGSLAVEPNLQQIVRNALAHQPAAVPGIVSSQDAPWKILLALLFIALALSVSQPIRAAQRGGRAPPDA